MKSCASTRRLLVRVALLLVAGMSCQRAEPDRAILGRSAIGGGGGGLPEYPAPVSIFTQHNDNLRTGAYLAETRLTVGALRARGMIRRRFLNPNTGQLEDVSLQERADRAEMSMTQVLYIPRFAIDGVPPNVAFPTTSRNPVLP